MKKTLIFTMLPLLALAAVPLGGSLAPSQAMRVQSIRLPGLLAPVRAVRDSNYIPHIYAQNDHDVMMVLGYAHAQDRFFQMDFQRHLASGRLAELVGPSVLDVDIQLRTLGLRRAAEESLSAYSPEGQVVFQAYADGVNAYLADENSSLPPEYEALELTKASVPRWSPVDSLVIGKLIAFGLSFDLLDIDLTFALAAYQQAGEAAGFDGTALFFEDAFRSAPFDPTVSIPGFLPKAAASTNEQRKPMIETARNLRKVISPEALEVAWQYRETIRQIPLLEDMINARASGKGSNWWVISGNNTTSGSPILASDPHLALDSPPVWYEAHLIVENDPEFGPMNVSGTSFAGAPYLIHGSNDRICWGSTVNPLDVTDVYAEELVMNSTTGLPEFTVFGQNRERIVLIPQTYRANTVGDGRQDSIVEVTVPPEARVTLVVPRRNNGPIVRAIGTTGISVQYTGWRATRELDTFRIFARARNIDDFKRGLQFFDFGSQNWSYADVEGNIAYFTSSEIPLREDLQNLGRPDGMPPFLIRDGRHGHLNEWLPVQNRQPGQMLNYEILPFEEMPQIVNPSPGFIANANQDPIGTTLDNNPLNQVRRGGGIYYLNVGYANGCREGRIVRLIQAALANGGKISVADMMRIQANNQMLDAEVLTPYILAAAQNAQASGAATDLAALANDAGVAEAVRRLRSWDFSTPTGLREGYDPGDDPSNLAEPSAEEIQKSVAATIYSVWRGRIMANTVDANLRPVGLGDYLPDSDQALAGVRNLLDNFSTRQGRGASGVNFFNVPGAASPEAARDIIILKSLREALDLLASDRFAAAFAGSTNQDDYRWGKLHRIVFEHPFGGPFNIPEGGGFSNVSPELPGVARSGGYEVVDASGHSARAGSVNGFMFGSGPSRRFVGEMSPSSVNAFQIIPGGQSENVFSPFYASMLGRWLTNHYHPLLMTQAQVQADQASVQEFVP
ncbi:MAG: penicillin acylase family protein [Acidobacteria bacterium]|nr:penicillin acylase family protein [Acidobacteriota bacterium]